MTTNAKPTYILDNERVRVGDWVMAPDTSIGDHIHEHDYLVIGITSGQITVVADGNDMAFPVEPGATVFGSAGDAHDVVNRTDGEVRFLEIDLKCGAAFNARP